MWRGQKRRLSSPSPVQSTQRLQCPHGSIAHSTAPSTERSNAAPAPTSERSMVAPPPQQSARTLHRPHVRALERCTAPTSERSNVAPPPR
eukprot:352911-Chlamydomonas_euryale.AAC.19